MKKILLSLLLPLFFVSPNLTALAENVMVSSDIKPPIWEEYVPKKYQNPRSFPDRGKNIAELSVGVGLTHLIATAPIGIPMICHATTKMKNQGWYEKKIIYENGLKEAESISNPIEKRMYYDNLRKICNLTDEKHQKQMKRLAKERKG